MTLHLSSRSVPETNSPRRPLRRRRRRCLRRWPRCSRRSWPRSSPAGRPGGCSRTGAAPWPGRPRRLSQNIERPASCAVRNGAQAFNIQKTCASFTTFRPQFWNARTASISYFAVDDYATRTPFVHRTENGSLQGCRPLRIQGESLNLVQSEQFGGACEEHAFALIPRACNESQITQTVNLGSKWQY